MIRFTPKEDQSGVAWHWLNLIPRGNDIIALPLILSIILQVFFYWSIRTNDSKATPFLTNYSELGKTGFWCRSGSQINQINKAYQTGGQLVIKPTRRQIEGGFLGTLASIGIPMAISLVSKMFGSGLQVDRRGSSNTANVYVPHPQPAHGKGYPYR